MSQYAIKPPDMSRNVALAGKTVSSRGHNITYDQDGYVVKAVNCASKHFAGTQMGVLAPNRDAVLAGGERGSYDRLPQDKDYFSDEQLAIASELSGKVAAGQLDEAVANASLDELRALYGYTGGSNGWTYTRLTVPGQVQSYAAQTLTAGRDTAQSAQPAQSSTPQSPAAWSSGPETRANVTSAPAARTEPIQDVSLQASARTQPAQDTAWQASAQTQPAQSGEAWQLRTEVQQTQDAVRQLQGSLGMPQTPVLQTGDEQDEDVMRILKKEVQRLQEDVRQLQYSYQEQLVRQQQQQTLKTELNDQQRQDALLQFSGRDRVSDPLLELMEEENKDR